MYRIGKEKLKIYKSLKLKKYRRKYNKFLVEGSKIISEVPAEQQDRVECLFLSDEKCLKVLPEYLMNKVYRIAEKDMHSLSSLKTPPGLVGVIEGCKVEDLNSSELSSGRWIGLEGISDPGNLGTIVRSAAWFGISSILLIGDCVDPFNTKVVQASMGAFWQVEFYQAMISDIENIALPIVAADMNGTDYRSYKWPEEFCLICGSESHGVSPGVREAANEVLSIPRKEHTTTDSLNLSVSASILMASSVK